MDEPLQCPICFERYTEDEPHDPRVLPCGHSICLACARSIQSAAAAAHNAPTCPLCRARLALPLIGVEALPRNFLAIDLLTSRPDPESSAADSPAEKRLQTERTVQRLQRRRAELAIEHARAASDAAAAQFALAQARQAVTVQEAALQGKHATLERLMTTLASLDQKLQEAQQAAAAAAAAAPQAVTGPSTAGAAAAPFAAAPAAAPGVPAARPLASLPFGSLAAGGFPVEVW